MCYGIEINKKNKFLYTLRIEQNMRQPSVNKYGRRVLIKKKNLTLAVTSKERTRDSINTQLD